MARGRCPTCTHVYAIHSQDGTCPRWAGVRGLAVLGTRVCIRVGNKWPEAEGHTIAYFADCVDPVTGMVLAWDLTIDQQFEAPLVTIQRYWTKKPGHEVLRGAVDELELRLGEKVQVVGRVG